MNISKHHKAVIIHKHHKAFVKYDVCIDFTRISLHNASTAHASMEKKTLEYLLLQITREYNATKLIIILVVS